MDNKLHMSCYLTCYNGLSKILFNIVNKSLNKKERWLFGDICFYLYRKNQDIDFKPQYFLTLLNICNFNLLSFLSSDDRLFLIKDIPDYNIKKVLEKAQIALSPFITHVYDERSCGCIRDVIRIYYPKKDKEFSDNYEKYSPIVTLDGHIIINYKQAFLSLSEEERKDIIEKFNRATYSLPYNTLLSLHKKFLNKGISIVLDESIKIESRKIVDLEKVEYFSNKQMCNIRDRQINKDKVIKLYEILKEDKTK